MRRVINFPLTLHGGLDRLLQGRSPISRVLYASQCISTKLSLVSKKLQRCYLKIEPDGEPPEDEDSKNLLREDLESVLDSLSHRERDVLRLRYGLDDGRMKTLEEIGQIFNVTRERIRQIEAKALRKLRHPNRNSILKEYIR